MFISPRADHAQPLAVITDHHRILTHPRHHRIDAADHLVISTWWADVLGGRLVRDDGDAYSSVEDVPGLPGEGLDFAPVPEPKAVKNRVHWDVRLNPGASVRDLRDRGAMLLRAAGDDEPWTVMADPEGNEFCVFDAE